MYSRLIAILIACALALSATAQTDGEAGLTNAPPLFVDTDDLDQFLWVARPLVIFADTPNDPRFIKQMELLQDRAHDLTVRDVVVITDTDPDAGSAVRRKLRPRGFMLALVDKDGQIELRKPTPWSVREITRVIDKTPLRQQELRDARTNPGSG